MTAKRLGNSGKELRKWGIKHFTAIRIGLVMFMLWIALWGLLLGAIRTAPQYAIADTWWGRILGYFLVNLGPELAGIVIGFVIIDALNEWRQKELLSQQLKAQLIRQMGSPIKDVAVTAARELAHHGWLYDGSLKGKNLENAKLKGAFLREANLKGANFRRAHLEEAHLEYANLERAYLGNAHLERAELEETQLYKAMLIEANLEKARLWRACLEQADLREANFEEARLRQANFERAYLWNANLAGAFLLEANLKDAHLEGAILKGAYLREANLEGAKSLTSQQLRDAKSVVGATMPDSVRLRCSDGPEPYLEGPTLEEWLATKPNCLDWGDEEEIDNSAIDAINGVLESLDLKDEEQ